MEVKSELRLIKCNGNVLASHEGNVFGFCTKCTEHVCSKCSIIRHFDHLQSFYSYDLECAHLTNFITKLKRYTQRSLKTSDKLIPQLQFKPLIDNLEAEIKKEYQNLKDIINDHCEHYITKVKATRIVNHLKNQLLLLTEGRIKQMKELKAKLMSCKTKLIEATINGKYFENLQIVEDAKKYKMELEALIEAQQKETDVFHSQIQRFTAVYVSTDLQPLSDICKIESLTHLDPKVYKICRETETLIAFSLTTKSITEIRFSDYKLPYNPGLIEIFGTAYIIGGSTERDIKEEENFYLDKTAAIDLDSGTLLHKDFMRNKRMCFGVTTDNNVIYAIGGYNHLKAISDCEKFIIRKNMWEFIPKLTKERSNTGVCLFNNKFLYCFGGYSNEGEDTSIERIDVEEKGQWEMVIVEENWSSRQNPGVIQISKEQILIFGGKRENNTLTQSLIFSPKTNSFEEVEQMKNPDTFLGCKPLLFNGKLHIFGCHENVVHTYNLKEEAWETTIQVLIDIK